MRKKPRAQDENFNRMADNLGEWLAEHPIKRDNEAIYRHAKKVIEQHKLIHGE